MAHRKLTKAILVDKVYRDPVIDQLKLTRKEVMTVISVFTDSLRKSIENLNDNERIELRGLGRLV